MADIANAFRRDRELQKWLWDLLEFCGVYNLTLGEHHVMAFRDGRKSVGLYIMEGLLSTSEGRELFRRMQEDMVKEAKDDEDYNPTDVAE